MCQNLLHDRSIDRQSFLKLSIAERRRILAEQAEWEEWINLDIAATYAP
jgi:hypothetical protein